MLWCRSVFIVVSFYENQIIKDDREQTRKLSVQIKKCRASDILFMAFIIGGMPNKKKCASRDFFSKQTSWVFTFLFRKGHHLKPFFWHITKILFIMCAINRVF